MPSSGREYGRQASSYSGLENLVRDLWAKSPLSHPDRPAPQGELLTHHLRATLESVLQIQARVGRIPGMPEAFWVWAALAALLHDAGKLPDGFQRMVGNSVEPPQSWGERHEVLSLGFVDLILGNLPAEDRLWIASVIAGHHRAFTGGADARKLPLFTQYGGDGAEIFAAKFLPADPGAFTRLCEWLHRTAHGFGLPADSDSPRTSPDVLTTRAHAVFESLVDRWEWALDFEDTAQGLTAVLLLGAVTMADHLSSGRRQLAESQPLTVDYRAALVDRLAAGGHTLRPQQEQAGHTKGHLLLRSWTASGKTEGALLWARTQATDLAADITGNPRIFYLLPYLASINAMTDRLGAELDAPDMIGVAHSKAASYHLARSLADGNDDYGGNAHAARKAYSRQQATRNFRELLRVGTPYQLLRGALAGPIHSSILADSANSVFVLDELHAFDARRLGMILAMMRLWERIGGRIAVLSATMPTALIELVRASLRQPVRLVEAPADGGAPVRHRIEIRTAHLTSATSVAEIRDELVAGRSVLVVANNVKDAVHLYEMLAPICTQLHGEDSAYLLHSRFKREHRNAIEAMVLERFAVGAPRRPGLMVGTQVLEVSLNIDLDSCHTSAADLEALLQRFGRANRIGALPAVPVVIHEPAYAQRHSGGEIWADGVYEEVPTRLAWEILTRHNGQLVDENGTTAWLDEVYGSEWGKQWRASVDRYRDDFERGFLTFAQPFDDRSALADRFDENFDGTEAILTEDRDKYAAALTETGNDKTAGRLLADRYLIPMPHWASQLTQYEKDLNVRVIDGEYDPELGLLTVRGPARQTYRAGWVL
ncbi:CRISPR-associated helicase Cas3' [Nocardia sp. NBC_01503]|uniref:CRISPR-associated helicase Cas3' n=1 Tax=Nocardia sp. NBC_01503 TaxID=2975997 RepID=UPI002E7B35DE|nr:CRISPR-associated helicase Cas3' [Nocardia sp. NBC_01503]WTL32765.1 CRISPR-associated helicase Cas3' [Nocardia sp. NBC_01503]